mgnify:CR=1 FL=1
MHSYTNLTPLEAAEYLRTSERTLIRWRNARTGPAWIKAGGKVVYQTSDLNQWLDKCRVNPVREQN